MKRDRHSTRKDSIGEFELLRQRIAVLESRESQRLETEKALRRRLAYEKMVADVSTQAVLATDAEEYQERCLGIMGEILDVSRIYIFSLDHDRQTMSNTHEWVAPGVDAQRTALQGIAWEAAPWWMEMIRGNRIINYRNIEDIPGEKEKDILRPQGIKSLLVVPLFVEGVIYGFVGFDECREHRDWLEEDVRLLKTVSEIITGVISRKRWETALQETQDRFRRTLDAAPDSITITRIEDGRYLDVNDAFCRISGYSREEALGRTPFELNLFVDPADRARIIKILEQQGGVNGFELQYRKKDGVLVDTLFSARPIRINGDDCLVSVVTDIREKKAAERSLRVSEEKYRHVIENAGDAIFVLQDMEVKFPNPKAREIGKSLNLDLKRVPFFQYLHAEDREGVLDRYQRRLRGEEVPQTYSFRLLGENGRIMCLELHAIRIMWEGRPATLNFLRDITHQRRLEEQLHYAQRMEAMGALAGGLAHDFNNLLMAVQGNTSLMIMDIQPEHPHFELLKNIESSVKSGADLTGQLLRFARGGRGKTRPIDLNALLTKTSQIFARTRRDIRIETHYDEQLYPVEADEGQIEQVLLNLYVNASHAMPRGGTVHLETKNLSWEKGEPPALHLAPGDYVRITVHDTGIGMDENTRQRIFEPFFTTKELGRGTGLGLASAYGIIKNHRGFIDVESEVGDGTTFHIYLPRSRRKIRHALVARDGLEQGKGTVLFVDDEETVLTVCAKMLERLGYRTIVSTSGQEAIMLYESKRDQIDVVILDMVMPEMGGAEVFERLKAIDPCVKVLLSSGYSMEGLASDILGRGCMGFIQKPFTIRDLVDKLREVLGDGNGPQGA